MNDQQPTSNVRRTVDLTGIVQGVGLRPSVYRLAVKDHLGGWVQNRSGYVRLVLEGPAPGLSVFLRDLPGNLPAPIRVEAVTLVSEEPLTGMIHPFRIMESLTGQRPEVLIPADQALCPDCRAEILDPADRHYGYAFTACTRCGPRYTVLTAMPYDRERTTLAAFPLCEACRREYSDPANRRFHAESTACPVCGPKLTVTDAGGTPLPGDPLRRARQALRDGRILAVRGVGGFLLAVDAFNRDALTCLRERKQRPHKPFAVMAPDLETLRRYGNVPPGLARLLQTPEAPIAIMDTRREGGGRCTLPMDLISPDTGTLGVMLPTTPLQQLLFGPLKDDPVAPFDFLVMTSGNKRGEPICIHNDEAWQRLGGIADLFLVHDREINLRNDDSVCVIQGGTPQVWRRGRGYAPGPIRLGRPVDRCVLAMGADMKNAIAVAYGDRVVLSPHVGDLDTPEALDGFDQVVRTLPVFLDRRPEVVAVDLHPDMRATRLGRSLAERRGLPVVEVQHHHAHAVACLAEHGLREGLALVMDGTGWGPDGTVWGAELLEVRANGFTRHATFAPVPLPGGDMAVRHPVRQLIVRWAAAGVEISAAWLARLGITEAEAAVWKQQCRQGLNAPQSHAAGRVFDAFSVLLGCAPETVTYEGQPAIRLEACARGGQVGAFPDIPFETREENGLFLIDWNPAFRMLTDADLLPWWPGPSSARSEAARDGGFHLKQASGAMAVHVAIVRAAKEMVAYTFGLTKVPVIALSGGVFMNRILNDRLVPELEAMGLTVLRHRQVPPGDGGIALGQAVVAGR
jgi:hydrogenase maturation protein HypF